MKLLSDLKQHLYCIDDIKKSKMDCYATDCRLNVSGSTVDNENEITFCHIEYDATFDIESFTGNATALIAHLASWVLNQGIEVQQRIDVEQVAENVFDIEIVLAFSESITGKADPEGEFDIDGQKWALGTEELWTAETCEIITVLDDE